MMSRKKLAGLATLVVVALIFMVWLAGLWPWGKIAPGTLALKAPPPPEKVLTIREVEIPQELTVLAAVISPSLTHISPQVSGRVSRIFVDAGSPVKQGDSLVALAAPEFQARAGQAQAQLTQVTADYQRYRRLLKEGAVSPREFEAMEARYEAAQAQMQEAAAFQKYTLITAPRTGVVAERRMAVGDLAQPGQTLISLYDPRDLQIEGEVNDDYRAYLKIGAPVRLEVPAANFQTDSTLKEIFPLSAPGSRTFKVRTERVGFEGRAGGPQVPRPPLKLPSPPPKMGKEVSFFVNNTLVPGMFARLFLPLGTAKGILIPKAAVRQVGQLSMVQVWADNRPSLRQVKLGRQMGEQVEVLSGLKAGEQVLLP